MHRNTVLLRRVFPSKMLTSTLALGLVILAAGALQAEDPQRLADQLAPWLQWMTGKTASFAVEGKVEPKIDGSPQIISFKLIRFDAESFDLTIDHPDYCVAVRRSQKGIAFCVPKHQRVFVGQGPLTSPDHLHSDGLLNRLVSTGTQVREVTQVLTTSSATDIAGLLISLTKMTYSEDQQGWIAEKATLRFSDQNRTLTGNIDGTPFHLQMSEVAKPQPAIDAWPEMQTLALDRNEIERQLARGFRRALEVLAPSKLLTSPKERDKKVDHGQLRWIDGQRVAILWGTPEEIGMAHGKLLAQESNRCIDSVLYAFGTVQTVVTGRWFREELQNAYARLKPHIPERHKVETRALASSLNMDPDLIEAVNVFPELFHCSGFALYGKATKDGKLYHGRVLDYMTKIGLQDSATTFIVAPQGMIPFANVGYAGFIGSVSGMNREKISLGEMGGRGEGQWDGVPMATLMRRGLEECTSLEQVQDLWRNNPRTCEYYYVFADGESRTAVGVAATPEKIEFIGAGEGHALLGDGIPDTVVLSAGNRLTELRKRVQDGYGAFDAVSSQALMCRPVAMNSNLHNVLFVPEDGVLYIANADHKLPAADRPYTKLDINELLKEIPDANGGKVTLKVGAQFPARDSLMVDHEAQEDARRCLEQLRWKTGDFNVHIETAVKENGDWLVRFPSAKPVGNATNDLVAMEWYMARNKAKEPMNAPAAVIVHESGSGMNVGRIIARALRAKGVHAFMIQLPYYGVRRGPEGRPQGDALIQALQQGIADARRARDAVAALPFVDASRISLQGTSLGGFVTATTAGLDQAYHRVFILLAGGDLYGTMMSGRKDADNMRREFEKAGLDASQIRAILDTIEPLRLAHRIDPQRTWLFTGKFDDVVPPKSSRLLADAVKIPPSHYVEMLANHYSGIIYMPVITQQIYEVMLESSDRSAAELPGSVSLAP